MSDKNQRSLIAITKYGLKEYTNGTSNAYILLINDEQERMC